MNRTAMKFAAIPAWTLPQPAMRGALALFETLALAGLEGQWLRLDAATQRAILGGNVFGRQEIRATDEGIEVRRVTCFGMDAEIDCYGVGRIRAALAAKQRLSPGVYGGGYFGGSGRGCSNVSVGQ